MKKNTGITLVALVITIIILLILAGVAISMITGGEGLFAKANNVAGKYNQAAKNEADLINLLLNGNYLNNGGNGQGGEEDNPQVPEEPTQEPINNDSHVGYYADLDPEDGKIDGIIFADLAVGNTGGGTWNTSGNESYNERGAYTIPVKTELKQYYESQESYTVEGFGTKAVLTPKAGSTGEDRFYIMALEDFSTTTYTWYNAAEGKMTDYAKATSVEFGAGRANTAKMIEYWNNKTYGEQNTNSDGYKDMWGEIQGKVAEGWFVPSRAEWAAFSQELGIITAEGDISIDISRTYWSSSQSNESCAYSPNFDFGGSMGYYDVCLSNGVFYEGQDACIRLATTF